jgi:uncharacterized SAM-binding protein YcdF (DUF218 family)
MRRHRRLAVVVLFMLLLAGAIAAWLGYLAVDIYRYSSITDSGSGDAAIVLGAAAWGNRPSPVFEQRIAHAVSLYKSGRVRNLILTGGSSAPGQRAESLVAADYAIRQGVPARDAACEVSSHTTLENLAGAREIIRNRKLGRVLIVSDPLHMRRAVAMARDLGIDAHPSPTPTTRYVSASKKQEFLLREVYYYASYLLARPFVSLLASRIDTNVQACR